MKKIKKIGLRIGVIILFLFILKQIIPALKLDGYTGAVLNILLLTDDTKYSTNYTDRKFLKIQNGMSKNEVYQILGKPLAEFSPIDGILSLQYSKSLEDTHYRIRQVYLKNEKVVERVSYFYVD